MHRLLFTHSSHVALQIDDLLILSASWLLSVSIAMEIHSSNLPKLQLSVFRRRQKRRKNVEIQNSRMDTPMKGEEARSTEEGETRH